jgi:hypothetical protein
MAQPLQVMASRIESCAFGHDVQHQDWREGVTAVIIVAALLVAGAWQSTTMQAQDILIPPVMHLKASILPAIQSPLPTRILVTALTGPIAVAPEPIVQYQKPTEGLD